MSRVVLTAGAVFALIIAIIAFIIGVVSLNRSNGIIATSSGNQEQVGAGGEALTDDSRVWLIAIGHAGTNYEYVDDESGEVRGFHVDMIKAVCRIAKKNCQLVYDSYQRCWESVKTKRSHGGRGLFHHYYDACTGWIQAYDRLATFKFSAPYTEPFAAVFTVKPGNPNDFNWLDVTGRTLGFIDGFAYDEHCIARESARITGSTLSPEQYKYYHNRTALFEAVNNDLVDAAFDAKSSSLSTLLEVVSDDITSCGKAGQSMMMRMESTFDEWWHPAFAQLSSSTEWKRICNGLVEEHGHLPGPKPVGYCIGLQE